jgi:feruloyl esterase
MKISVPSGFGRKTSVVSGFSRPSTKLRAALRVSKGRTVSTWTVAIGAGAVVLAAVAQGSAVKAGAANSCASLSALALPNATITVAQALDAGLFVPPDVESPPPNPRNHPAFCRVTATLTPTPDSDIKIEVWMPASGWNGKYQAVGNGAFNGSIPYAAMMNALTRGYATSSTDTGHTGNNARFAQGHPEKAVDFGWRAVHEMTIASKRIIAAYYDNAPRFSYWSGCSAGGRQAMKEAQRFPADFDGIIAGSPGLDWTGRATQAVRVMKALEKNEAARLSPAQTQMLHRAAVNACDALDGTKDGLIADPSRCRFDPSVVQCKGAGESACLTPLQVETARMIYSPVINAKTKREIAGLAPGSELGWTPTGWTASARATGVDQFRFLVFNDPGWDVQQFDAAADVSRAEDADGGTINALDPNLKPFLARGGKLIQYHGWSDPQISPFNSTQYYARVVDALGGAGAIRDGYRLFMAPGMGHCTGGEGPSTFDMIAALEQWVEHGKAPDQIVASHSTDGAVDRTRPLCPYPQIAVYTGKGSIDETSSFECKAR